MNIIQFYFYWRKHRYDTLDELNLHGCTLDEYAIVETSFNKSWKNHKRLERIYKRY